MMQIGKVSAVRSGSAKIKTFQVLGERNSGTNFLQSFLAQNLYLLQKPELGWKHGFPAFVAASNGHLAVVIFREALGWCRSMFGKPWHASPALREMTFEAFLRAEWNTYVDQARFFRLAEGDRRVGQPLQYDRHPVTGRAFQNLLALRNAKNAAFAGLAERRMNVAFVRHEDVVADPAGVLQSLSDGFDLQLRVADPIIPDGQFGWKMKKRQVELPPAGLMPGDRAFVVSQLDLELEARIGYRYGSACVEIAPDPPFFITE